MGVWGDFGFRISDCLGNLPLRGGLGSHPSGPSIPGALKTLQDVLAQILVLDDAFQGLADVLRVYGHGFAGALRGTERQVFEQPLHDGVQSTSADVLYLRVDLSGDRCDLVLSLI